MPDFIGPLSHQIHDTTPVSYSRAQKWINAYTARSQQHPHMHPDAILERRVAFGANSASGGVTMAQLRKVSQGLGGERKTPEPEAIPELKFKKKMGVKVTFDKPANGDLANGEDVNGQPQEKQVDDGTKESEWVDADQWAEQRDGNELGEIGQRSNFMGEVPGGEAPEVEEVEAPPEADDKEKRKAEKKAKRKAEKLENEAKRRKADED